MDNHKKNLREAYNSSAQAREKSQMQPWKIKIRAGFLSLLQIEQKKSLLEIGAGPGRDSAFFQEQGLSVTCIDLSPAMIALCKEKGLNAHVMDMTELAFPPESFDAVYTMSSLLHLKKNEFPLVLKEIEKILKPGGFAYIGVYGGYEFEGIWEDDHQRPKRFFSFFTDAQIEKEVIKIFDIHFFERLDVDSKSDLHYQSLILEKRQA